MPAGAAFDFVSKNLEDRTTLSQLEARGTVRLALKESGLDAAQVTAHQMGVVLEKVLPRELESRGIGDSRQICDAIAAGLAGLGADGDRSETPESVFARLG